MVYHAERGTSLCTLALKRGEYPAAHYLSVKSATGHSIDHRGVNTVHTLTTGGDRALRLNLVLTHTANGAARMSSGTTSPSICVNGRPPNAVLFELRRLGNGWFDTEPWSPSASCIARIYYVTDFTECLEPGSACQLPTAELVWRKSSSLDSTGARERMRFNIGDPLQRLALLAWISKSIHKSALTGDVRDQDEGIDVAENMSGSRSIAHMILAVQFGFNLHVTVVDLSRRLGVHPSTIDRWCVHEGGAPPREILRRGMMHAVGHAVLSTNLSLGELARSLRFSASSNLARFVRRNFGCTFRERLR